MTLNDRLQRALRTGLLFDDLEEPLDDYGKRIVRKILSASPAPGERGTCDLIAMALKVAREATNGWACYAQKDAEHAEISRLHTEIDRLSALHQPREGEGQ